MEPHPTTPLYDASPYAASDGPASLPIVSESGSRHCPYCYEEISLHARKCWRCHEYFSPPREDLDERMFQLARREVLQDCLVDIKKWIGRIGFGSAAGILLVAVLSSMRFQDVLEDMVADRVATATAPMLKATEKKLEETEQVLDDVQDNIRLAQHRIAQFDRLDDQLMETETAIGKIELARQGLETRADKLSQQFGQLENRLINSKRELRNDRERRLEEMLGNFANRVVTFDKLRDALASVDSPQNQQLLATFAPMQLRRISLISPFTLNPSQPTVLFSPSIRLEWQFETYNVGQVIYRVYLDTQRDFSSGKMRQVDTRLSHLILPADFPHGPVYWRVEAVDRGGNVQATSDTGYFEFYSDSIDRIRRTGIVRVGVACSSQGEFAYFDEELGELTGYDIELTRWLATRLMPEVPQLKPVFMGYNWNRLLNTVSRNEVDFIISTITITPEREEEYSLKFSRPYYKTFQACVVLSESQIRSASQLQGRKLAVQAGTSSETVGEAFTEPTNLHRVANSEYAFDELLRGQVDAVITDLDFAQGEVSRLGRPARVIPLRENDFPATYTGVRSEEYGIAVAKPEVELIKRLNAAIEAAEREEFLKSLKQRFLSGEKVQTVLRRLPTIEVATPRGFETWRNSSFRR